MVYPGFADRKPSPEGLSKTSSGPRQRLCVTWPPSLLTAQSPHRPSESGAGDWFIGKRQQRRLGTANVIGPRVRQEDQKEVVENFRRRTNGTASFCQGSSDFTGNTFDELSLPFPSIPQVLSCTEAVFTTTLNATSCCGYDFSMSLPLMITMKVYLFYIYSILLMPLTAKWFLRPQLKASLTAEEMVCVILGIK